MTNEEARDILIQDMESLKANPLVTVDDCLYEAFDTAIKALEQTDKIEESNFSTEQYKTDLQGAYDCGYAKALERQPRWIPVSERLPQEERKEWHFDGSGYLYPCLVTRYSSIIPKYVAKHYFDGKYFINDDGERVPIKYIIAWMPLPEPYKPESEE